MHAKGSVLATSALALHLGRVGDGPYRDQITGYFGMHSPG